MKHRSRLDSLVKVATCVPKVSSGRLAAAVWLRNDLIAVGVNQKKTHPMQKKYSSNPERLYLHAEIDAIVKATRNIGNLSGCVMYVARARESGSGFEAAIAKSCSGCYDCCSHFGLKGVFYTVDDANYGYLECN